MQIRVKTKNKVIELETVPGDSMKRVKQMIEEKEGISMKLQKLTFSEVDSKYARKSTHCKAFFFGTGPSNDRRGVDVCYFYNSSVKELYSHAATMWHADEEKKKTGVVEPDESEVADSKLQKIGKYPICGLACFGLMRYKGGRMKYTMEPLTFYNRVTIEKVFRIAEEIEVRDMERKKREDPVWLLEDQLTFECCHIPQTLTTIHLDLLLIENDNPAKKLIDDYSTLLKDGLLGDITIRVRSRDIPTHQAILNGRSPQFLSLLKEEKIDGVKNVFVIDKYCYEVVYELIHWIYTGKCSKDISEIVGELLCAAETYRLDDLKAMCEKCLIEQLATDSCHPLDAGEQLEPSAAERSMQSGPANMGHSSQTEIKVDHVTQSWTVKNFSDFDQGYIEQLVELPRGDEIFKWLIKIYPKGSGNNNKDFVFLSLNRVVTNPMTIGFKSRFILKSSEGKDIDMRIHPNPSNAEYVSYIKRDMLFEQIFRRDSIIVSVEIDVAMETITTSPEQVTPEDPEKKVIDDYARMFTEGSEFDFTIGVDDQEIRTHTAVLSARSPYFRVMLTTQKYSEARNGFVKIKEFTYEVLWQMVYYIYSGRCSLSEIAADELLMAANKYGLDQLKTHCETYLMEMVDNNNVCELLVVAEMHGANRLKKQTLEFIQLRPIQVTQAPGWNEILKKHHGLVTEIVNNFD